MNWMSFPFYKQLDSMDCGPTCLRMVASYFGKAYSIQFLREKSYIDRAGVSMKGISEAAESIGFRTLAVKVALSEKDQQSISGGKMQPTLSDAPLPCIVHWNQNHFVVAYKITKSHVYIADPGDAKVKLTHDEFKRSFCSDGNQGLALLLEATPAFYSNSVEGEKLNGLKYILHYLNPHYQLLGQLSLGLLVGTVLQMVFPFLTQSLVDIGIETQNLNFIHLILIGQLVLIFSQILVKFLQSWILLHISTRLNVNMVADFLFKMMKLPLYFFDSKNTGDIFQRISDHRRIESFVTQSLLASLLAIINLVVFSIILLIYNNTIFLIYASAAILYISYITLFLKKRKEIDYKSFQQMSDNQDALYEIIQGMQEIKLQGSHQKRRSKWMDIQSKLFNINISSLTLTQYQDAGTQLINNVKDILITYIAAIAVMNGELTLGMMIAIQYIIGQLNSPLQQLVTFIRSAQDAKISIERISEIHNLDNEEKDDVQKLDVVPDGDIVITDLSFRYTPILDDVLQNINLVIERGKTTAIVGTSGSGKTTLMKILLGFYQPTVGQIRIGHSPLTLIKSGAWRARCGAVMQDGYVFSDTIANNIAECDTIANLHMLNRSIEASNLKEFVDTLPLGLSTKIGSKGNGISQGQKQRLLIARAIYKNPDFLFFDEATNALDANNERVIMENLYKFLEGKTAVIVAHRLSTVKNADKIIVLENGKVVEEGSHRELVERRCQYFTLVQNQLELGQ